MLAFICNSMTLTHVQLVICYNIEMLFCSCNLVICFLLVLMQLIIPALL